MGKSKWWKNKETGEVVLQTGSNRQNMGTVFYRVRSGETFSEAKSKFFSSHAQIEASGFPAEKPKEPEKKKRVKSARPAKYRNPSNPEQTWTGLGKPPAWVDVVGREACLITAEG
jgi:DNA-binding protein H-NS